MEPTAPTGGTTTAGDDGAAALESRVDAWEALMRGSESDDAFFSTWTTVAAEIGGLASSASACRLLESDRGHSFRGRLASFQRRYLRIAEHAEAESLLGAARRANGSLRDMLRTAFARNTFDRLEEAVQLVDFDACPRVVVVGCGPFPAAALFLHERTHARAITAIDVDRSAARLASRLVRCHGCERLEILCQDGCEHDYRAAGVVYVTNQVTSKPEVLRRVAETATRDVRVLLREPFGPGRLLADSVDAQLPAPWSIVATGTVDPHFFSRHLLLARQDRRPTEG